MVLNKEVDLIFGNNNRSEISLGHLVCNKCRGYYKLKDNELPTDFTGCECGNTLEFIESNDFSLKISHIHEYYDEYKELQKIVDIVRIKAQERKEFLEQLHTRIKTQEKILNEIKQERITEVKDNKWSLWDLLEEKGLDIKGQKTLIEDIIEHENKLMGFVKEKRKDTGITKNIIGGYFVKIGGFAVLIAVLGILTIYVVK